MTIKDLEDILLLADRQGARVKVRSIDGRGYATWVDMKSQPYYILLYGIGETCAEALADLIAKIKEKYPDPES